MTWKEKYKDRLVTSDEAVSHIRSGDKIIVADWVAEPLEIMRALIRRASELEDVEIIHGLSPGPYTHLRPEYKKSFHHTSLFMGAGDRKAAKDVKIDYLGGTTFYRWPDMFAKNPDLNPHWAFVSVTPPDEDGMCTFSATCDYNYGAAVTATHIIAQVNEELPIFGGFKFPFDKIDYPVAYNDPPFTVPSMEVDELTERLADNVASLIEDGATIQLGFGSLPNAIATRLMDKKDLGVHTETLTENMMDLIEAGVITNKRKTLHPGVCVGSQCAGTTRFLDYVNHNPMFEMYPIEYVNDPYVIGKNYKMTSINACIAVDLLGQATAESIGGHQFSGIGGQLDYVRGSQLSEGGKSILTLSSTAKNGTISKIIPYHEKGTVITVSRYDINYVVTEYGVADLKYKTVAQRAKALIAIAHPQFREALEKQAREMGLF